MEIEKDGLYTYAVSETVCDSYFLSVEYPIMRYSNPDTLLSMILREQDEDMRLLYDISDAKSLRNIAEGRHFSREDCEKFLRDLIKLLRDLEELMLDPSRITFVPDYIYQGGDGHFRWLYRPDQEYELQKEVKDFFAWMLSEIDYGDSETVRFVYHVYWMIRNRALNIELLRKCLDFEKNQDHENITSYESFFQDELSEKKVEKDWKEDKNEQEQRWEPTDSCMPVCKKRWAVLEIVFSFLLLSDAAWLLFVSIILIRQGRAPYNTRSWIAGILLLVLFAEGIWQCHKKKRMTGNEERGEKTEKKLWEIDNSGGNRYQEVVEKPDNFGWIDDGEETVRLNKKMTHPGSFLLSESTGEKIPIEDLPFAIGNVMGLNHLAISDRAVSRRHAVIERGDNPGTYQIRDLGSTNGTWINQERVGSQAIKLKNGDILFFAKCSYQFYVKDGMNPTR